MLPTQIAEWTDYIANHYELLKTRFPGTSTGYTSMIVISRASAETIGNAVDKDRYLSMIREQLSIDEVLTYDDLATRAQKAYGQLQELVVALNGAIREP